MSSSKTPLVSGKFCKGIDHYPTFTKPSIIPKNPSTISTLMWRNFAKQAFSRNLRFRSDSHSFSPAFSFLGKTQQSSFPEKFKFRPFELNSCSSCGFSEMGFRRSAEISMSHEDSVGRLGFGCVRNLSGRIGFCPKGYASVAEAVSSTDVEEDVSADEEIQELLQEMNKEEKIQIGHMRRRHQKMVRGMGEGRYQFLRRRQVKIETEAWEQALKEYKELLMDMCEQKLAPNLPYVKSLFLGWFEPLRNAIDKEQELCRQGKNKTAYAPYFVQLPAEMMAVITMHKLMGLLMTGGDHGIARVVQAACIIGDAIEQEVWNFFSHFRQNRFVSNPST